MGGCAPHTKALAPYSVLIETCLDSRFSPGVCFRPCSPTLGCVCLLVFVSFPSFRNVSYKILCVCVCVCSFFLSFCPPRDTRSTCSGCHAGWLPSPPGAICFSLSRRQGRLRACRPPSGVSARIFLRTRHELQPPLDEW